MIHFTFSYLNETQFDCYKTLAMLSPGQKEQLRSSGFEPESPPVFTVLRPWEGEMLTTLMMLATGTPLGRVWSVRTYTMGAE